LLLGGCASYPATPDRNALNDEQLAALESSAYGFQWLEAEQSRAVAVLVHGLNLNPAAMQDIATALLAANIEVLSVSLSGHADGLDEQGRLVQLSEADFSVWQNDVRNGVLEAARRSGQRQIPLYLVGFSLGGLLSADYLAQFAHNDAVNIERMVLFAPAITLRWSSWLLYPLQSFPDVVLPSAAPEAYRANDFAPVSAYLALYAGVRQFREAVDQRLNIPVLLFMHPRDELVSDNGLREFISEFELDRWRYVDVQKSRDSATVLNHLIIGPHSLGTEAWERLRLQMLEFLAE
jgi:pimeloyl-ACP methyl ester carboxylesterase